MSVSEMSAEMRPSKKYTPACLGHEEKNATNTMHECSCLMCQLIAEISVLRGLRQEDGEFKVSLGYTVRWPQNTQNSQTNLKQK